MIDLAQNLLEIRKKMGLNQTEMAKKFGIAQRTWSSYETGRSNPPMEILFKLEEEGYTISGISDGVANDAIKEVAKKTGLSEEEVKKQAIEHLHKLAESYSLDTPVDELPKPEFKKRNELLGTGIKAKTSSDGSFIIPILDQSLSAGKGQPLPDEEVPSGYIEVPKELKRYGDKLAALYVNGDSMEPTLQRGDLVVCDSCGWDGEGIYALRMDGCGYVKRLARKPGKIVVISDNPKYQTWEEPSESQALDIVGRVHYTLRHID
mgnify:CR=1 FL=1